MQVLSAVVTTGIYCRPGCGGRPLPGHVRPYTLAAAAESDGFRPCLRCRPYRSAQPVTWTGPELVCRAVQLITDGALDGHTEAQLASRLGVSSRHLRRLFVAELGVTPDGLARSRRAHFARRLLDDTDLPVAEIAFAAGFGSVRQLHRACRDIFRAAPAELRGRRRSTDRLVADGGLVLRLPYQGGLDWARLAAYLQPRAIPGVEHVNGETYRRTIVVDGDPGVLELGPGHADHLILRVHLPHWADLIHVVQRARHIANLDLDLDPPADCLSRDPVLGPLVAAHPGVRPPGTWDPFETGVRAIVGQQVSVAGATTLAGRLVARFGPVVPGLGPMGLSHTFPAAEVLADADLSGLGLTGARERAVAAFARSVERGDVRLDRSVGLDELVAALAAIPGLGPWTAHYIALRLGEPDAFPATDLGVRRALAARGCDSTDAVGEAWRPWRALATAHLWADGVGRPGATSEPAGPELPGPRRGHPFRYEYRSGSPRATGPARYLAFVTLAASDATHPATDAIRPDPPPQPDRARRPDRTRWEVYRQQVATLEAQYAAIPPGEPVRLAKKTSNLFRPRPKRAAPGLDVHSFDGVIDVDPVARTADVLGMTTYEHLVDATLPYGLMPLVVPELKTITLGGAITGLGIESSSFRNGMPHEAVVELDVLTGDGRVVTATRSGDHADLYFGFPNSYGTLGYALRARIELEPVRPYVHLRHLRFSEFERLVEVLGAVCADRSYDGEAVDFVDGTVFSPSECYLTLGSWTDSVREVSEYTRGRIYYRSIQSRREDWLTVRDYLWRWDTDWFWCSRAFGVQRPWVRRLLGISPAAPRLLRSDSYWRVLAWEERFHAKATLDRWRGRPVRENVIQDVELPIDRLSEFVSEFQRQVPISPFWLCPLRQRDPSATWELYRLDPGTLYVNVGFWSSVPLEPAMDADHHNRWVEDEVDRLGGRKSLYSTVHYPEDRFWAHYNGPVYRELKRRYDPGGRLLDLYAKCVG